MERHKARKEAAHARPGTAALFPARGGDFAARTPGANRPPQAPLPALSPEGRASAEALAARRANLELARAAPRDRIYRRTRRRREASRRNIQRPLAWRRSPQGNARARLNAFQHGLAAKTSPELRAALGEAPEDFGHHLDLVARVFLPRDPEEGRLVERLAQASWNHMRVFRAQARMERFAWRRLGTRPGRLTLEEFSERAYEVSKLFALAHLVDSEAGKYEDQIERLLAALLRARAKREGVADRE